MSGENRANRCRDKPVAKVNAPSSTMGHTTTSPGWRKYVAAPLSKEHDSMIDAESSGPWVVLATFCLGAPRVEGGVTNINAVYWNLVDEIGRETAIMPTRPQTKVATFALLLASGTARGQQFIEFIWLYPDGARHPGPVQELSFPSDDDDQHDSTVVPIQITFTMPGVYWLEVMCNGRLLTRTPLRWLSPSSTSGQRG